MEKTKLKAEEKEYLKRDEEGRLVPDYDKTIKVFAEGDIIAGEVVRIDRDEVLVDVGYKSEGVIPIKELSVKGNINPEEVVSVGEEIVAFVLQKEDQEGRLILSKKRADQEKTWADVEKKVQEGGSVKGKVVEAVKGGLILDIGLRGFLPASLIELSRVKDLKQYIGRELECKVIEMNRFRNNVVLSRRALLEKSRDEERKKLLAKLKKGEILPGRISNITTYGAFVDLGGIDGLIHISELSWSKITHPEEVVSIGDEVKVQVLEVDEARGRVSLGLKQTQEDPWRKEIEKYSLDDIVEGKVDRLVPFGAFVVFGKELEGLIHLTELSEAKVEKPKEVLKEGEKVKAKIIEIDLERRRISLSLKAFRKRVEEKPKKEKEPKKAAPSKLKLKEKKKEKAEPGTLEAVVEEIKEEKGWEKKK